MKILAVESMELRDEFAMAAMQLIAPQENQRAMAMIAEKERRPFISQFARFCYEMADAMIEERERTRNRDA